MPRRPWLLALLAAPGLILGTAGGVTVSAFRATTSNPANTFSAASSFPVACPAMTPHHLTGWEPGLLTTDLDWQPANGTAETIDSTVKRTGAYSAKVAKTSLAPAAVAKSGAAPPTRMTVLSVAVRLESLPAADATLAYVTTADTSLRLGYQAASQKLTVRWGAGTPVTSTVNVAPRTWYSVDLRIDTSAAVRIAEWRLDGAAQAAVSSTGVATDQLGIYLGSDQVSEAFTANYDDFFESRSAADYPAGPLQVTGLRPNGMGTHSGASNFRDDDGTAVDASSYLRLDDAPMNSATDGIAQLTASTGSYVELTFEDTDATCIRGVQSVVAVHRYSTGLSDMKTSIFDGTTERVVFSGDPGGTTVSRKKAVITPATSWSQTSVNALVGRIGYSNDASPYPGWDAALLEVASPSPSTSSTSCTGANPVRLTGFESGVVNSSLFDNVQGGAAIDPTVRRSGTYSVRAAKTAGANAFVTEAYEVGVRANVVSVALRLNSLPSTDVTSLMWMSNDGSQLLLGYRAASQTLTLRWGAGTPMVSSVTVAAGTWYSIGLKVNTGVNPRTADWRIDGVDQTPVSSGEAAGDQYSFAVGSNQAADVFTAHYDDYVRSRTLADYPVGPVSVRPMRPSGLGTSSGAISFQNDDGTAINALSHARLDDSSMSDAYEFVKQVNSSAAAYLELSMEDTTETCIKGVQAVVSVHKTAGQTNNMRTSIFDGATERVVHSGDPGSSAVVQKTAVISPATSWSQSAVNGLTARLGYSTDVNPNPVWDSVLLEYGVPYAGPAPVSYAATVLADGPVGYWRMGDLTKNGVDEARTSDGVYSGAFTLGLPGALPSDANTSADFAGAGVAYVVPNAPALNVASQVSVEAWIKPDTVAGTRYVLHKGGGNPYSLYIVDNKVVFGVRTGGVYKQVEAVGVVTTGSWQHIVGTFDGSTLTLYRNGVKAAETILAGCPCPIDTSVYTIYVGSFEATSGFFDGGIDEVALYGSALTATQVQNHYARR